MGFSTLPKNQFVFRQSTNESQDYPRVPAFVTCTFEVKSVKEPESLESLMGKNDN